MAYTITMPRGDLRHVRFCILDTAGEISRREYSEIYFTVKRDARDRTALFQRRLSDGGIVPDGDGYYHLSILPEDTDGLAYGRYVFDIELLDGDALKETPCVGTLHLTYEVTHAGNEVTMDG